jgi:hypothetical protein
MFPVQFSSNLLTLPDRWRKRAPRIKPPALVRGSPRTPSKSKHTIHEFLAWGVRSISFMVSKLQKISRIKTSLFRKRNILCVIFSTTLKTPAPSTSWKSFNLTNPDSNYSTLTINSRSGRRLMRTQ